MNDWGGGIIQAMDVLVEKCTKRMSQIALVEISARRQDDMHRTGEAQRPIIWTDPTDMGDVSAHQLIVGNLDFSVLDYGNLLHLPLRMRQTLNEWDTAEKNQRSTTHLADGVEWKLQKRPRGFSLGSSVSHVASGMRILEYERGKGALTSNELGPFTEKVAQATVHGILTANRDRDFRFRTPPNGD